MTERLVGSDSAFAILGRAYLRGDDEEPIGTDHLLIQLTTAPDTRDALQPAGLTPTVAKALSRRLRAAGEEARRDGAGAGARIIVTDAEKAEGMPFTAAAAGAVRRAAAGGVRYGPRELLIGLLGDPDSRAARMLRECGVEPAALGLAVAEGRPVAVDDPVGPHLRDIRDRAIGRAAFRSPGRRRPLAALAVFSRVNFADRPASWIGLEAREQAGGRTVRTDDLLLAALGAYEVLRAYPYLGKPADRWDAVEALWAAGARYADLRRARDEADPGAEPAGAADAVRPADDADALVRRLLADPDGRAARLLAATRVTVPAR